MELEGKRVLVLGLGLHGGGVGVTRWLVRQGAVVTVTDLKTQEELASSLAALGELPVRLVLGGHREEDVRDADLIVRNPGVPRESPLLKLAREREIPVRMELGLFLEQLPRGVEQVVGITGTKGKTTTTLMVGEILSRANRKTVVAGNLRVSALEFLDRIDAETPVVLEMSSFQLEEFDDLPLSPHIAAITNLSPDHLNRYPGMAEYVLAKANIFRHQRLNDWCILNFDSSLLTQMHARVPSQVVWFSSQRALRVGAYLERGMIVWRRAEGMTEIMPASQLGVPGAHNVENALAATATASVWGAGAETIREALRQFKGTPHRLEVVRELDGVTYINDTTATAPAAAVAALETLRGRGRIILLAGGSDKGLDYGEMAQAIADSSTRVVLLEGTATPKLEQALRQAGAGDRILGTYGELAEAVERARAEATPGEVVLLSPGAASFGMFVNEFERGDKFRQLVSRL